MNLYIIRHGETNWNIEKKIQGLTDIELNDTGIAQAKEMKSKLTDIDFDLCLCSPLKRAKKTAETIIENKCPILEDTILLERNFGTYEGKRVNDIDIDFLTLWDYKINYNKDKVEPLKELLNRCDSFIEKIKTNYKNYKNILIVSHGAFIKGLYYSINGYNQNTDFSTFHLNNCELYKCEIN